MPRNVAITIGVNHYQYERSLDFAGNDAQAMQAYLNSIGFDEVWLYSDTNAEQALQPELTQLRRAIRRIGNNLHLTKEDSFWFFFSGHGGRQGGRDYLLPINGDPEDLAFSAIAIDDVIRSLRACKAGNLVMILDACRNVIPADKSSTIDLRQRQKGVITLFSCEPGQKSYELPDLKQGAFTYCLLRALQGEYNPNRCNVGQLSEHLHETLPRLVAEKLNERQSPYVIAEPVEKATQMLLPLPQKVELKPQPQPVTPVHPKPSAPNKSLGNVRSLIRKAVGATQRQQWEEAKTLWERVLIEAHDLEDRKWALEQRDYVSCQQSQQSVDFNQPFDKFVGTIKVTQEKPQLPNSFSEDLGNGVRLEMILIQKGSFMMGSTDEEVAQLIKESGSDWYNNEKPQHRVEITEVFYLGKFQVTQGQWQAVMGSNPSKFQKGDNYPVEQVSWDDCQEFLEKLNQKVGKQYRLPSEAEWEYACRAGTTTQYCFGDNPEESKNYAWSDGNSENSTQPVGQKKPNKFGLYDMHGNVWEWCEDSWKDNYKVSRSQKPFVNSSKNKVLRGGAWDSDPGICRSAYRADLNRDHRYNDIGFRVACALPGIP